MPLGVCAAIRIHTLCHWSRQCASDAASVMICLSEDGMHVTQYDLLMIGLLCKVKSS